MLLAEKDAAKVLREILRRADTGELIAPGPQGKRLVRRIEGAVSALESKRKPKNQRKV